MKNQVQLIAFVDRLSGGGFGELKCLFEGPLAGVFGGANLFPFFTPIDGSDAGFDPIDHTQVDRRLGTWEPSTRTIPAYAAPNDNSQKGCPNL